LLKYSQDKFGINEFIISFQHLTRIMQDSIKKCGFQKEFARHSPSCRNACHQKTMKDREEQTSGEIHETGSDCQASYRLSKMALCHSFTLRI